MVEGSSPGSSAVVARGAEDFDVGEGAGWPSEVVAGELLSRSALGAERLEAACACREAVPSGVVATLAEVAAAVV